MPTYYSRNIKKYPGSLLVKNGNIIYAIKKNGKYNNIKSFPYEKGNTNDKNRVMKKAKEYQMLWSIKNDQSRNAMNVNVNNETVKVNLGNNKWLYTDLKHLPTIENNIWYPQKGKYTWYAVTVIKNDKTGKWEPFFFHQMIKNKALHVDHINGNGLDNRCANLFLLDSNTKQQRIQRFNRRQRRDNTSGVTGVYKYNGDYPYWYINGKNYHGRRVFKKFSVKKYGDLEAFELAKKYRQKYINDTFPVSRH